MKAVTNWTIRNYRPARPKPKTDREDRAVATIAAPLAFEMGREFFGKPTVRGAAEFDGQSKSTLGRRLNRQGNMPKRERIIAAMPKKQGDLVRILDATLHHEGTMAVRLDDLCFALWDGVTRHPLRPFPEIARSTRSTRRRRMAEYLDAICGERLGYHALIVGDHVAIRRGRRFRRMSDVVVWVDEEIEKGRVREVRLPKRASGLFWEDRWVRALIGTLELGCAQHAGHIDEVMPLLDLMRLAGRGLLDVTPVLAWVDRAIHYRGDRVFLEALDHLSDRIEDAEVRRQVMGIVAVLYMLKHAIPHYHPYDVVLSDLEYLLPFHEAMARQAPESRARVRHIEENVFDAFESMPDALDRCRHLREMEASGMWEPPGDEELEPWLREISEADEVEGVRNSALTDLARPPRVTECSVT